MPWIACAFHPWVAPQILPAHLLLLLLNTFMCIQYQYTYTIYIYQYTNTKTKNSATVTIAMQISKKINTSLHKPVIPIIIAQLPCALMACLQYANPKWPKLTSLKLRFPLQFWFGMEENVLIKWAMKAFEKNPCSFEVTRVWIQAN